MFCYQPLWWIGKAQDHRYNREVSMRIYLILILLLQSATIQAGTENKPATQATRALLKQAEQRLPIGDFADGSLISEHTNEVSIARFPEQFGPTDYRAYRYLEGDYPSRMHPGLFARGRDLYRNLGLFQLKKDSMYQIRGDIAGVTLIRGNQGWILLDVGLTREFASRAWAFARQHLPGGDSVRVTAVVYSHSHADHFGGVKGFVSQEDVDAGRVEIIAPHGFLEAVLSETVLAGPAMQRRGHYHFGSLLDVKADGTGFALAGDGLKPEVGESTFIPPTHTLPEGLGKITPMEIDGVSFQFMDIGGLEAPSATAIYLPEHRLIFDAELLTRKQHNIYTLRGASIRDALGWSKMINRILHTWGADADSMTGAHGPTLISNDRIQEYLRVQRDMYGFLHNQSVRLMNSGTKLQDIGREIEAIVPPELSSVWHTRGYHGTWNHNAKGVVNRYLGFYDGNPANLDPLEIRPEAIKFVEYMGGADSIMEKARADFEAGEYVFVATVMDKLVTAQPGNRPARALLADAYEQLGYQSEGPQFRHAYLSATLELRAGEVVKPEYDPRAGDIIMAATTEDLLDLAAAHIDVDKLDHSTHRLNIIVADTGEKFATELAHSNLSYIAADPLPAAEATLTVNKAHLIGLITGSSKLGALLQKEAASIEGSTPAVQALFDSLSPDNRHYELVPSAR